MPSVQLNVTLPDELADALKAKVENGEYADESEVIRDSLRVLFERDSEWDLLGEEANA